jgi:hypothetical protein
LLNVVGGGSRSSPGRGQLAHAPPGKHVELVTGGLVASLPPPLQPAVTARWEQRAQPQVARLLALGWTPDQLLEHAIGPPWAGVANPGAVLVKRLAELGTAPRTDDVDHCGSCGPDRMLEDSQGRVYPCPKCSPRAVTTASF